MSENGLDLSGQVLHQPDLSDATLVEPDLRGLRVVGAFVGGLEVWPFAGRFDGPVLVDGVDVTAFVEAELDRRYPERAAVRQAQDDGTVAQLTAAWTAVRIGWAGTLERLEQASPEVREQRVRGEWSAAQTLRHLVAAVDIWIGRMLAETEAPFHPLGLLPEDYPLEGSRALGLDPLGSAPWPAVRTAFEDAGRRVDAALGDLTDADLGTDRTGLPAPDWGPETRTARQCVAVVLREHVAHRRYLERDLATLLG
ncbi:DinB family protein [Nocardioides bruguierae]|uniref:DinB family protein n=1 Tax=Nocardioides bruguierae TaxID=2945102 RepID=A0A9X2D763_9ACTN|nr:DinB family protein [Nocardioides bruguierae]MCM0620493.1 DinB family protein [Nocardioides bruguierae]